MLLMRLFRKSTLSAGIRINWLYPFQKNKFFPHRIVLGMILNCIRCETLVLEIWGMWRTSSLTLLPGQLWLGVVVLANILSKGQLYQLKIICIQHEYLISYSSKLFVLRIVTWSYDCWLRIIISYVKPYNCVMV